MNNGVTFLINKILGKVAQYISKLNYFITPLSILLFCIIICIFIFITEYILRYNRYNYWDWKKYALLRFSKAVISVLLFKLILNYLS